MAKRFWKLISNYGEKILMTPEEHRQNRVLNHGMFYATGLYLVTYVIQLAYFYFMLQMDHARYADYFIPFTAATVTPAILTLACFWIRKYEQFATLATVLAVLIAIGHNLAMLLFLGLSGGFQFFLAALIPAAYLSHPHRRLVYIPLYLLTLLALLFGIVRSLTHPAFYPIPEPFQSMTFYLVLTTASIFAIASFAYIAYRYDWIKRAMVYWEALSVYGLRWTDSDDERTHHIITNQTMVLHAIFPPVIILVSLALSLVLLWQGTPGWWKHLLGFSAAAVVAASLWFLLFRLAANFWRAGFIFLYLLVDFTLVTYLVLLTGSQLGIQFFFIALIPLPIYLFPNKRRLLTAEGLLIGGAFIGIKYSPMLRPWLEIPSWIVEPVYMLVVTLIAGSLVVGSLYIWLQRKITQRIFYWWEKISLLGIPNRFTESQKKEMIIFNRFTFLAVSFTQIFFPLGVGLFALYAWVLRAENLWTEGYLLLLPPAVGIWLPGAFLYAKQKKPHIFYPESPLRGLAILLGIVWLGIFVFWTNICLPFDNLNHLFFIAHLAGAVILLPKANGFFSFRTVGILIPIILYSLTIFWHQYFNPLYALPTWALFPVKVGNLFAITTAIVFAVYYLAHESEKSEAALETAHEKSESLLLNILPRDVADELKDKGNSAPVRIESVTVMFTDFAGFTKISESLTPEQVVDELDKCFSYFDQIMEKYNLEKLKTIGDSYMCAGGIPKPNHTHAVDCCLAAMEIQSFMNQMKEIKAMQGLPYWELRLGIHTGPLVAGVVGHKKFAYDVWGDTVNTASRMESSGTTGKINISWATYEQVKFLFECEHRGQVAAKNKGMIDMYYLKGVKKKYSAGGEGRGRVPNRRFKEIYAALSRGAKLMPKTATSKEYGNGENLTTA